MSKETPCIAVCMIDPKTSLCFGCGRTLPEIARWHRMERAERLAIMALLPARMADAGLTLSPESAAIRKPADANSRRRAVSRLLLVLVFAATIGAVAYKDPGKIARASDAVSELLRKRASSPARAVQIARGQAGEFALHAKINGVTAPMVIDTGATSVVLTFETAKAAGLPLELLEYNVDVETAGGHTRGGTADAGSPRDRQAGRAFGAGTGGAARTDEDQSARHELSGPAGKLGSARRPADAARLSLSDLARGATARRPIVL